MLVQTICPRLLMSKAMLSRAVRKCAAYCWGSVCGRRPLFASQMRDESSLEVRTRFPFGLKTPVFTWQASVLTLQG